jgi:hypothetical protein
MKDGDTARLALLDARASLPFEHHDHRSIKTTRFHSYPHAVDEGPGRPRSIPPPAVGPGTHHIRGINEKCGPVPVMVMVMVMRICHSLSARRSPLPLL